jgi:F-type H+/Na+-transporting ATPase subunit beta
MTATVEETSTEEQEAGGTGRVVRVIGPVVDVEFAPDEMPEIYHALTVERTLGEDTRTLTMEVAAHIGDNMVRAISMQPTDGLVRGSQVEDSGAPISVPVGDPRSRLERARHCARCRGRQGRDQGAVANPPAVAPAR